MARILCGHCLIWMMIWFIYANAVEIFLLHNHPTKLLSAIVNTMWWCMCSLVHWKMLANDQPKWYEWVDLSSCFKIAYCPRYDWCKHRFSWQKLLVWDYEITSSSSGLGSNFKIGRDIPCWRALILVKWYIFWIDH